MTYYTEAAAQTTLIERLLAGVSRAFAKAAQHYAQRRVFHTTMSELGNLSNRELADLGISRTEVRRIAWEAAYRH